MIDSGVGTAENYPAFSVAGGRARNQAFTLDGGNVSNAVGLTRPPAVDEPARRCDAGVQGDRQQLLR